MGVVALVGPKNALGFFLKEKKIKGSIFFFVGFLFIIAGWYMFTFLGFLSQLYGIFLLFRSFLGTILIYGQGLPVVGGLFRSQSETIQKAVNKLSGTTGRAKFEV